MKPVQIRNLVLGEGRPKVCVPIVGPAYDEIMASARECVHIGADLVEWRADYFAALADPPQFNRVLADLPHALEGLPLLFTLRSAAEGGAQPITPASYVHLNQAALRSGQVDLIDVELASGEQMVADLIETAHQHNISVMLSSHNFSYTPPKAAIVARLRHMQDLGADLCKIAVMPTCKADVLTLLAAALEMSEHYADRPIVALSMGALGLPSRLYGGVFGSALTFGTAGQASAPGQIPARELRRILSTLHPGS